MDLATIQQAVRDDWPETLTTTVLDRRIAAAVREYSRYNPRALSTTLTTVADQAAYTISVTPPVNGIWFAFYALSETSVDISEALEALLRQPTRYGLTSQYVIEDIKEAAHIGAITGDWEWWPGTSQLVLDPTPTASGLTVYVTYWTGHVLNTGGTAYATIPDADLNILVDLTLAELLTKPQLEAATSPDYAEGSERVTTHFMGANIAQTIDRLRSGLIAKYGGTGIFVGP